VSQLCQPCTYLLARGVGVVMPARRHAPLRLWPAEVAAYSWPPSSPAAVLRCAGRWSVARMHPWMWWLTRPMSP
jgi:hypothetical protein